ncbi:protein phosphatase Slingshot homolog 1 isoform X6 [Silurus meridionalis]|uniref:protein phosphatase Slingshot homolog 1 isoform X6 n=1 Tax=Silurus meridionalis TaxID=175797 RepID=UPI001EEC1560|nr:protein phosphatase Slingshot homolog 1 isoform X6 [Silurus meridionalis]
MALLTLQRSPPLAAHKDLVSDDQKADSSLCESFYMVKGAALFLQQGGSASCPKTQLHQENSDDLPQHLQAMLNTLRFEDRVKLAVRLESSGSDHVRYMVAIGSLQENEGNILVGMDFTTKDSEGSIGMVLPLWSDTKIHLEGDGCFSVRTAGKTHIFKPVSIQVMWPTKRERTESLIRTKLLSIMTLQDLENVTSKEILNELEQHVSWNQQEYKEFIDNEMLLILSQIYKSTLIFDYLYLGSEWDASNLEELRNCGIGYILNMTQETDNFFPELFCYYNVHEFDEESDDLLAHWNKTYDFIKRARESNSKCLVHCKMGMSHSVSTVIAYAMKENGWPLEKACDFVKKKRIIAQPNAAFMKKLANYEGILETSQQTCNIWQPCGDHKSPEDFSVVRASGVQTPKVLALMPKPEQWDPDPSVSPCCWDEPSHHPNYNYYFRRLSDAALDSEPSTPVRCLPLLPTEHVFIEIEDVERDALLEDSNLQAAQLVPLTQGMAAQTLEDMRMRLEFSTVEEEDEEEAQKEEAEMAALANKNCFGNENANNSNRLAAKRSCPSSFDDSSSSEKSHKVKPTYQSSMCLLNRYHVHRHNLPNHACISIQNPPACQYQSCGAASV